jgi:hypothetical protein
MKEHKGVALLYSCRKLKNVTSFFNLFFKFLLNDKKLRLCSSKQPATHISP